MHTPRRDIAAISALALIGSFALVHLMALPPFEDEASQVRLIRRVLDAGEWLQPLSEGKPLEVWPMAPLMWLSTPLVGIRAVHVLAGIAGAMLTWRLALLLGAGGWVAFTCGAFFAICPYAVYLERLALSDMLLCAAGVWVLVSVLGFLQSPNRPQVAALGAALVVAACCKLPVGFVFLLAMPLALALMPAAMRQRYLQEPLRLKLLAAHAPAMLLALAVGVVSSVRWHRGHAPGFGVQDLVGIGLGAYSIHLPRPTLWGELTTQLSWPVVVLGVVGVAASAFARDWRLRWLLAVGGLPMLAIGLLARFWFPRYLLFTLPPLIVAAVFGWHSLAARAGRFARAWQVGVAAVCGAYLLAQSARLILAPPAARWSVVDRYQYFQGTGSGYGYPEAAAFLLHAVPRPHTVYSLDGHSAEQLRTYLPATWQACVAPLSYGADGRALSSDDERLQNLLAPGGVWIVAPEPLVADLLQASVGARNAGYLTLRRLAAFEKPGARERVALYEVTAR